MVSTSIGKDFFTAGQEVVLFGGKDEIVRQIWGVGPWCELAPIGGNASASSLRDLAFEFNPGHWQSPDSVKRKPSAIKHMVPELPA